VSRGSGSRLVVRHAVAGVVVAVGPDAHDFAPGDHVIGTQIQACGTCRSCSTSKPYQCSNGGALSRSSEATARLRQTDRDVATFGLGAFAEYSLVHQNQLVQVPEELPFSQAAILGCATATGVVSVI